MNAKIYQNPTNIKCFSSFIEEVTQKQQDLLYLESLYRKNCLFLQSGSNLCHLAPETIDFIEIMKYSKSLAKNEDRPINSIIYNNQKFKKFLVLNFSIFEFLTSKSPDTLNEKDWVIISSLSHTNSTPYLLKFKWFSCLKSSYTNYKWTQNQDENLRTVIRHLYPRLLLSYNQALSNYKTENISWSKVSYELNKMIRNPYEFKNNKKCKERWNNHLSPFLNKEAWTLDEDIKLLEESCINPRKWAKISRKIDGRNQHSVKNRFLSLIKKEFDIKREEATKLLNQNNEEFLIKETLEGLYSQRNQGDLGYLNEGINHFEDSFDGAIDYLFGND